MGRRKSATPSFRAFIIQVKKWIEINFIIDIKDAKQNSTIIFVKFVRSLQYNNSLYIEKDYQKNVSPGLGIIY